MKKTVMKVILAFNSLLWIVLSSVNYVGIMQQFKGDVMRIFLWSIFTVMMYGMVVYSINLVMKRIYLLYQYRNYQYKYMDRSVFMKQLLLLGATIFYLYGICLYNANFLGLLPLLLFFGNKLTTLGRLYVYDNDSIILFDSSVKVYLVKGINLSEKKIFIQDRTLKDPGIKEVSYQALTKESKFLEEYSDTLLGEKEVA